MSGRYDNGAEIVVRGPSALVYNAQGQIWAEASPFPGGYLFVFDGANKIFTARLDGREIHFSNSAIWRKVVS